MRTPVETADQVMRALERSCELGYAHGSFRDAIATIISVRDKELRAEPLLHETTTDQLWRELRKRSDNTLLIRATDRGENALDTIQLNYTGHPSSAAGLAAFAHQCLISLMMNGQHEPEDE